MARTPPSEPKARLFVALDLPAGAREWLDGRRASALRGRDDLRPVATQALHVTLAFLGYRPEAEVGAIAETVDRAVRACGRARLVPAGLVGVPPRRPRLFALDLEDPSGQAAALHHAVSRALSERGFYEPEARPFWPHVTLARVKKGARAAPLREDAPAGEAFEASEVTLYRSLLSPRGARYEAIARTGLA